MDLTASGTKLRKTVYFSNGITTVTDYSGKFVYKDTALDFFHTAEGRVKHDNDSFEYQYKISDHLGNVRVMFGENGNLTQDNHYYPFGMKLAMGQTGDSDNKYLYNGKELEDEHGLNAYDYVWRRYYPDIGKWWSIDPVDQFHSPFSYGQNNSIS